MRELFEPAARIIFLSLITGTLAFPVLGAIQWISPEDITPFDSYIQIISHAWVYMYKWGDWAAVVILSFVFFHFSNCYAETAQAIRLNRVLMDFERWDKTPYISPLFYFYLVTIPPTYSNSIREAAMNRFYQTIMNQFRNRVYFNAANSQENPDEKPSWLKVAGISMLLPSIFGISGLVGFFILLYNAKQPSLWFTGWEKFFIPVLIFITSWVVQQLYAIITIGSGKDIDDRVLKYFGGIEPRITWREVFPDRPYGEAILNTWEAVRDQLQQNYYYFTNKAIPADGKMPYDNPALPPYPFPYEKIPEWANDLDNHVSDQLSHWQFEKSKKAQQAISSSKGKIITFKKK